MTTFTELLRRLVFRRPGQAETPTIRVFVSYAHEDVQTVAGLVADLENEGLDVWFAPRQLDPGDSISRDVRAAIEKARFFLVALTQQARNSAWVAKEIEYALDLEKRTNQLRVVPLFLSTREAPDVLKDRLAIDVRPFVYKAGVRQLADTIRGNLSPGQTPLACFEQFVSSLPIVDNDVELGRPSALSATELEDVRAWLRTGRPATLAVAARLYANRFVGSPTMHRIRESDITRQVQAWVSRGELPAAEAPRPDWVIDRLVEEALIEPFRRNEYSIEADDDRWEREFHAGRRLLSVGKAGYLFDVSDPDRPHADYPIGRFPGSTPGTAPR